VQTKEIEARICNQIVYQIRGFAEARVWSRVWTLVNNESQINVNAWDHVLMQVRNPFNSRAWFEVMDQAKEDSEASQ